jgi:hypothetical protein
VVISAARWLQHGIDVPRANFKVNSYVTISYTVQGSHCVAYHITLRRRHWHHIIRRIAAPGTPPEVALCRASRSRASPPCLMPHRGTVRRALKLSDAHLSP